MNNSVTQPGEVDAKFARDAWLRALGKTATIGDRGITLPALIDGWAVQFGAAPALVSNEASMSYRQLAIALQSIRALGDCARFCKRRCRVAADGQLRRVSGHLAGSHAHRRRGRTDQFPAGGRCAGAFDQHRAAQGA